MIEGKELETLKEIARLGSTSLETAQKLCGFLARIFGTIPEDVIGVLGGDWLRQVRIRNFARLAQRTEEILRDRGILESTEPVSPTIALPILEGAQAESREELQELWARLLANAMDPKRSNTVRKSIISVVKEFDPLDAFVLNMAFSYPRDIVQVGDDVFLGGRQNKITSDEFEVSIQNLKKLDCIEGTSRTSSTDAPTPIFLMLSPFGREVVKACEP